MGYHFGVGWLQGGFFSLDIFYVLSGYLITDLLLGEYRKRRLIKLSAFWLRRVETVARIAYRARRRDLNGAVR